MHACINFIVLLCSIFIDIFTYTTTQYMTYVLWFKLCGIIVGSTYACMNDHSISFASVLETCLKEFAHISKWRSFAHSLLRKPLGPRIPGTNTRAPWAVSVVALSPSQHETTIKSGCKYGARKSFLAGDYVTWCNCCKWFSFMSDLQLCDKGTEASGCLPATLQTWDFDDFSINPLTWITKLQES